MDDQELPSEDSSDEDYLPEGAVSGASSGEHSSGNDEIENIEGSDSENKLNNGRRKKPPSKKKSRKKNMIAEDETVQEKDDEKKEVDDEVEKKSRADALWADFMKDCGPPAKKSTIENNGFPKRDASDILNEESEKREENKIKVKQIFEFAGEKVEIEKEIKLGPDRDEVNSTRGRSRGVSRGKKEGLGKSVGGISTVLNHLGKKSKLSTLEKSKLDWQKFKDEEGIGEEISSHNKGRNGYLEKQDFLERTDIRQFELEKDMRATKRSKR